MSAGDDKGGMTREARLAEQLRANLRRRKTAARKSKSARPPHKKDTPEP